ncbi:MAG: response regulator [Dehalococcoidia bacterium]|nr:MAG: response regulator [Dehalococcoidia bacterium]
MALMTVQEVADYLRVTTKTVYRLLEKDSIPATKVGRQWRFDESSIDVWLRQQPAEKKVANILVIDDDQMICLLFKDALEALGHAVTTVENPLKGLDLVKNGDYDLVFLDLKMPGMDGAELLAQIRIAKPKLPVTVITGYPESELMMRALVHGPLGVMSKPFRVSDVLIAVNNYLRFGTTTK